ncbi:MAG: DMT family transporter [Myxococcota bacterium]
MTSRPETTGPRPALIPPGLRDMALASLLFAVMGALVKLAERHLPVGYAIFARSAIGLALSYLLIRRAGLSWLGRRPRLLALRGAIGFSALYCTFQALGRLPIAHATVILQTQPIWTAVAAAIFLREKAGLRVWIGCALALTGVVLAADPRTLFGDAAHLDPLGVALALLAALLSACAYVTVRALRRSDHPLVVVFWFALVATPASLPTLFVEPVWPTPILLLVLLGIGVTVQIAQVLMTRALHREPAGRVAAVGYLQVVYAFAFGALFFDEAVEPLAVVGALVVLTAAATVSLELGRGRARAAAAASADASPSATDDAPLDSARRVS